MIHDLVCENLPVNKKKCGNVQIIHYIIM